MGHYSCKKQWTSENEALYKSCGIDAGIPQKVIINLGVICCSASQWVSVHLFTVLVCARWHASTHTKYSWLKNNFIQIKKKHNKPLKREIALGQASLTHPLSAADVDSKENNNKDKETGSNVWQLVRWVMKHTALMDKGIKSLSFIHSSSGRDLSWPGLWWIWSLNDANCNLFPCPYVQ